jgi:hypothetical protein
MRLLAFSATLVAGAGCTGLPSNNITTSGMSASMHVTADGTGQSKVNVQLNVDNNGTDFVDLSAGDTLVARVGAQSHALTRAGALRPDPCAVSA